MNNVYKLRQGLDIRLAGAAQGTRTRLPLSAEYALLPAGFVGLTPRVVVREGDHVLAGDALFVDKTTAVRCVSPVSGVVQAVVRGDRRRLLAVRVAADKEQQHAKYDVRDAATLSRDDVMALLLSSGLMAYITQLPYAVVAAPAVLPKAIAISALRDMPLECPFEVELAGQEAAWQAGLTALSRVAPTYLGIGSRQTAAALVAAKDVAVNVFDGRCPAGNVGVQVNHVCPVNKGEVVWTVEPTVVLFLGRLLLTGEVDLTRCVAVAGSEMKHPSFVDALVGTPIAALLAGQGVAERDDVRLINGNPLTGALSSCDDFLLAHASAVCAIPEGAHADEMLGWLLPRVNDFSVSRSYLSWLQPKSKTYTLDARVKGSERHMIMSGEYGRVLPMDICAEYLIKAILAGNIDRQEALGIYEVSPADFAVAEFVCSSKMPLQQIVRRGLDILRKENA